MVPEKEALNLSPNFPLLLIDVVAPPPSALVFKESLTKPGGVFPGSINRNAAVGAQTNIVRQMSNRRKVTQALDEELPLGTSQKSATVLVTS